MKIYFAHNTQFDYQKEWYDIIRNSTIFQQNECIFPHEHEEMKKNSYPTLQTVDCIIAEVSHHSTGAGIELGWSQTLWKPIFCVYKTDSKLSNSLKSVTNRFFEYDTSEKLIETISHILTHEMNHSS